MRRLHRLRAPEQRRHFRKTTTLAHAMLAEFPPRLPPGCQGSGRFDSWDAAHRLRTCGRRQPWHVVGAITSHRQLDAKTRSQWPPALRPQRYQRGQRPATAQRPRPSLGRTRQGQLNPVPFAVWVLISQRPQRDTPPQYFLCTALSLSAQHSLRLDQKRWPLEGDNFSVKQHLGLAAFRVQSYEATEQWCAIVFLAMGFLHWRLNPTLTPTGTFSQMEDAVVS